MSYFCSNARFTLVHSGKTPTGIGLAAWNVPLDNWIQASFCCTTGVSKVEADIHLSGVLLLDVCSYYFM
jgi:hypothetical protein